MKKYILYSAFILSISIWAIIGCAVNPVTGKKQLVFMSEAQEIAMGKEADPEIIAFFGLYENPQLQQFIDQKGQEMAAVSHRPDLNYEFKIVDSPVLNAFAVPGGYVYFTRGIMAHFNNEAEFAGVLGHEIGHVTARHSVIQQRNSLLGQIGLIAGVVFVPELAQFAEPLSQGMQLVLMSFGREAERESDELGVEYSSRIGYDASEMAGFFNTLERKSGGAGNIPDFLSTHPSPTERNATVAQLAEDWKTKLNLTDAQVNRNSYLQKIDGLIYGEDPKQGFVEGGIFYHPELKFEFPIPSSWSHQNTPQQVQMAPESGDAVMSFSLAQGTSVDAAAAQIVEQYGLELVESNKVTVNGLPAIAMIADQKQEEGTIRAQAYVISYGGNIYNIMGVSTLANFTKYRPAFLSTMQNFKELTDAEKLNRKPELVRIKTLNQTTTLQSALSSFGVPSDRFEELAILNGMQLSQSVQAGTMIKVIEK